MERPSKRAKISLDQSRGDKSPESSVSTPLASLQRSISPPARTRSGEPLPTISACPELPGDQNNGFPANQSNVNLSRLISSPFELTHIQGLTDRGGLNEDTVKLRDILGNPMIKECWQFNYCFDVDFLMSKFDQDVRSLVKVKIVHGSWERESMNKIHIDEACTRYPNIEAITAYMPERFGTHHSKLMILIRHDDLAQVVIHTANMIPQDWTNMTQAVWRSPLLPLLSPGTLPSSPGNTPPGTGSRFKRDLLTYLRAYGPKKTGSLVQQLSRYDFGAVRAALVASVPSKQHLSGLDSGKATLWGWPALKDLMTHVPVRNIKKKNQTCHIVIQVSSIASLGQTDKWIKEFFKSLAPTSTDPPPKYSIIWPTPEEVYHSLDGYASGGSIHMKTQSAPQQKQVQYLRPHLCQWAGDSKVIDLSQDTPKREAGRGRAAPHIKTYIRFSNETMTSIDWAMVTSANLSTQAWGAAPNASGEVRISSFEVGVVVWPALYGDSASQGSAQSESPDVLMVPCFKQDQPDPTNLAQKADTVVGLRMPYDLPLTPYRASDEPWSATAPLYIPDLGLGL
ncbi:hypothetical protein N7520_005893 [Penicillium odoratum]|uniref:uncharacterized protein n=1 Tax=Penicillium odoratum TaxID=1167516 RepID=UPI00254916A7|nr:uncharacterized protein N7520_005893 [Penicillium odoratum]KAJ5758737.1 hypothetical protein N7520_005893 [Penicillium odoratum]